MITAKSSETICKTTLLYPEESYLIQGECFDIYKQLRNTQKESVNQRALTEELLGAGLDAKREKQLPVFYKGKKVGTYTPEIPVNDAIILELKAKPFLHKDDIKQFWYYLKNSDYRLGYLINFGGVDGVELVRRVYDMARDRVV